MKKSLLIALVSLICGLLAGAVLFRGGHGNGSGTGNAGGSHAGHDHSGAATGSADAEMKDEVWTCSMHPQVKQPNPGKCPICAMALIPLSSMGGGDGERSFSMSEAAQQLAGITTTEVVRGHPQARVRLFGKIMYDETRMRTVAARFPARIDRLFVDYTGIRVEKGDHLATVYSPELLSVQTELLTAKKFGNDKAAQITRDKLRLWGFSDQQIRQIESSGETSDQLTIDAPASGIVTQKNVSEGDYVETGTPYFKIADLDEVWVMLDAYESDTPWLRFGQSVEFTTESIPGRTFEGRISFLSPELDPSTRTVSVRVNVPNEARMLKPGMFVSGVVEAKIAGAGQVLDPSLKGKWISPMHPEIIKDQPGKCDICGMDLVEAESLGYVVSDTTMDPPLLVPAGAVLHTGKRSVVYVQQEDADQPTFEGREVLLGPRAGDQYIVEAGLNEGEKVVAEGGFVIDSALQIQAKPSMMTPSGEAAPLFPKSPAPDEFLTAADGVLKSYFALQKALAGDSLDQAKAAVREALLKLEKMPVDSLPDPSRPVWKDVSARFQSAAVQVEAAGKIDNARLEFQKLSDVVDEWVHRFGTAQLPVYQAFCPMAFDNKGGTWLQSDDDLLNPYFGASMLKCGEVKNQIAEAKAVSLDADANAIVQSVLLDYYAVKDGLTGDSLEAAKNAAEKLDKTAAGLSGGGDELLALSEGLREAAQSAASAADIEAARLAFEKMTTKIEAIITGFGGAIETPVYKAFCPMAFDNKGANWLQAGDEIENPYFGASMLKCGEIKQQLATAAKAGTEPSEK